MNGPNNINYMDLADYLCGKDTEEAREAHRAFAKVYDEAKKSAPTSCVDSIEEVINDLNALSNLLTIMEGSVHYKGTGDEMVCRALRNNIEHIRNKLVLIITNTISSSG